MCLSVALTSCVCGCVCQCVWVGSNETRCTNRRLSDSSCHNIQCLLSLHSIHSSMFVWLLFFLCAYGGVGGGCSEKLPVSLIQPFSFQMETQKPYTDTCCSQQPFSICQSVHLYDGNNLLPWNYPCCCGVSGRVTCVVQHRKNNDCEAKYLTLGCFFIEGIM